MHLPHLRFADRIGNSAYAFCIALAMVGASSTACFDPASAVESMSTFQDIMVKGTKVGQDVQEYLRRNNPDAARAVVSRHMREVDDTIEKVKRDSRINNRNKAQLLTQLTGYRSDLEQSRNSLSQMSDLMAQPDRFRMP